VGIWTQTHFASDTLEITLIDATNGNLVPGDVFFTVKGAANLKSAAGTGSASTDSEVMGGSFSSPPSILSVLVPGVHNVSTVLSGEVIIILFNQLTNFRALYGSRNLTTSELNALLRFSITQHSFGAGAIGRWSTNGTNDVLTVTIVTSVSLKVIINNSSLSVRASASLKDLAETTDASSHGPVVVSGIVTTGSGGSSDKSAEIIIPIVIIGIILIIVCVILIAKFLARPAAMGGIVLGARVPVDNTFSNVLFNPHVRDISFDNPRYQGLAHVSTV
jgi:hypothetical protein